MMSKLESQFTNIIKNLAVLLKNCYNRNCSIVLLFEQVLFQETKENISQILVTKNLKRNENVLSE